MAGAHAAQCSRHIKVQGSNVRHGEPVRVANSLFAVLADGYAGASWGEQRGVEDSPLAFLSQGVWALS